MTVAWYSSIRYGIVICASVSLMTGLLYLYNRRTAYGEVRNPSATVECQTTKRMPSLIDKQSVYQALFQKHRVLCMIISRVDATKAREAILETWGKRCHIVLLFIGGKSEKSEALNNFTSLVTLEMNDTYDTTWIKVRMAIEYIDQHYGDKFDWFVRADDDTFLVMENLHLFMGAKDPAVPEMYGINYKTHGGYIATGAGIIISNITFDILVKHLNHENCSKEATHNDDVEISKCLKAGGVRLGDSRDAKGRVRFMPLNAETIVNRHRIPGWFWDASPYKLQDGLDCCADDFIGFHYVSPEQMRMMEFLIYYVHPFSDRNVWKRPSDD